MKWAYRRPEAGLSRPAHGLLHVWRLRLDADAATLRECEATLDQRERDRARAFRFAADRARFIVARGWLRRLVAAYTHGRAADVSFVDTPFGKPCLPQPHGSLRFNLSHSGDLVLFAFGRDREVGVDVERIAPRDDMMSVARYAFSDAEMLQLGAVSAERFRAFYKLWTRKEAYLKARGNGLSTALRQTTVPVLDPHPEAPTLVDDVVGSDRGWGVLTIALPERDYFAAVAAEGCDWSVQCMQLDCQSLPEAELRRSPIHVRRQ